MNEWEEFNMIEKKTPKNKVTQLHQYIFKTNLIKESPKYSTVYNFSSTLIRSLPKHKNNNNNEMKESKKKSTIIK